MFGVADYEKSGCLCAEAYKEGGIRGGGKDTDDQTHNIPLERLCKRVLEAGFETAGVAVAFLLGWAGGWVEVFGFIGERTWDFEIWFLRKNILN